MHYTADVLRAISHGQKVITRYSETIPKKPKPKKNVDADVDKIAADMILRFGLKFKRGDEK